MGERRIIRGRVVEERSRRSRWEFVWQQESGKETFWTKEVGRREWSWVWMRGVKSRWEIRVSTVLTQSLESAGNIFITNE